MACVDGVDTETLEPCDEGGGGYTPSFQKTDVPGVSFDARSGKLVNAFTGRPLTQEEYAAAAESAQSSGTGGGGLTYQQQLDLKNTPSRSVSQSYSDPAALQIQRDQLAQQALQAAAQLKAQVDYWNAQIAETQRNYNLQVQNLDFLRSKETFAQSQDNKRLLNETNAQLFNQEASVAGLGLQITQMEGQRQQINAQMQQQVALANQAATQRAGEFNATMGFEVQRANEQAEQARQDRLAQLNRDIASFASDPGDRGAYAALALANSGWGQMDAAMTDADLRTNASLFPLEGALGQREEASVPRTPYSFTPIQAAQAVAPQLGAIDLSGIRMPQVNTTAAPAATQGAAQTPQFTGAQVDPSLTAASSGVIADPAERERVLAALAAANAPGAPRMEDGGLVEGSYISGEAGPELNIPIADGKALVLNAEQLKKLDPALVKKIKKMADGGVFSGGSVLDIGTRDKSRNFLDAAVREARAGTPFQQGTLPTPVFASTPGFDPIVASLLASINAQARGIPQSAFLRQAQMLTPMGMREGVIGRTA